MCKTVDALSDKLDDIIQEILKNDQKYSMEEIYEILEDVGIETKRYEPGTSVKEYFDILVSYGVLDREKESYISPSREEEALFAL